jgi:hypothetical protein
MKEEFDRFEEHMANDILKDESHLPVSEQSLVFRLRKRAEIRRQIQSRKSVEEGKPDRISDLLEEAANEIQRLEQYIQDSFEVHPNLDLDIINMNERKG